MKSLLRSVCVAVALTLTAAAPATAQTSSGCTPKSSAYSDAVLATSGIVSLWRLDESSGTVACDFRRLNDGTYSGGYSLGQLGALVSETNTALGLSGNGRVAVRSSPSLGTAGRLSVEAWVRPSSGRSSQTVVRKEGQYLLRISNSRLIFRLWRSDGSTVELSTGQIVGFNSYQHVVATFDGTTMRTYRNGVQVASGGLGGTRRSSSISLLLGSSGGYDGMAGQLDEVAIYSQALPAASVDEHWDLGRSVVTALESPPPPAWGSCLPAFGDFVAGSWPSACWRPFGAASPFNHALPAGAKRHPNSDAVVSRMVSLYRAPSKLVAGDADTAYDYSHPIYYPRSTDPVFTLHCYESSWGTCPIEGHRIRIPDAARAAGGGDAHMAVIDQASGWEYDLYKVRSKPAGGGTLELRWGGRTRIDGDGLGSNATAAHFGLSAGVIRAQEMQAGRIDHALFMVVKCTAGKVYPAGGAGAACSDAANAPAGGARFQLDYTAAEIDALAVPAWKKTILHALRTYGAYIGDTGGGGFNFQFESGSTYTSFGVKDRMVEWGRTQPGVTVNDGKVVFDIASGVDWSRLRVIDPCVTQRTC
jgi:hypothetical protein